MGNSEAIEVAEIKTTLGKSLFVQIYETKITRDDVSSPKQSDGVQHLPEGSEPIGARERLADTISEITELVDAATEVVTSALKRHAPTKVAVELKIGFTGKAQPIPFLVGAEAEAALKITMTWETK